jgi:hypothetical protein
MTHELKLENPAMLMASLNHFGWLRHVAEDTDSKSILQEIGRIADLLGYRAEGRAGAIEEIVRPQTPAEAHPQSLSAKYGLSALPFHTELSHRLNPCHYVILGCIEPGTSKVSTRLLDWRKFNFTQEEYDLLESAPILVRSGRRSFYSTLLPTNHTFLRFDPGCIEAVDKRGQTAIALVENRIVEGSAIDHYWSQGDILIIDNWRILHGREASATNSKRCLARVLVNV